jgi:hypothetical protein
MQNVFTEGINMTLKSLLMLHQYVLQFAFHTI